MLFTRSLITRFIPGFYEISDEQFAQSVNALGMEVESIYKRPKLDNVVTGQLLEINKVEGTHLSLCKVKVDDSVTKQIVCGASGLITGKYVVVALPGAKLPNGIIIAKRQIHNMESDGMLCAYSELTNNKNVVADAEQDEIIMFNQGKVGSQDWIHVIDYEDTIYDITVPANRNDENAYLVFCYEIANKLELDFNFDFEKIIAAFQEQKETTIAVNKKVCASLFFLDYDLKTKWLERSEWKTKAVLMNHGIKPFNYLMDKLSFITLLTNCPTNVYDTNKIIGEAKCSNATPGLKFVALNNKTYDLTSNDIVIYDNNKPISLACVIGSEETKLTQKTTNVKIEVGNFNYAHIRNTALRLNIDTDAAKRASRPLSTFLNFIAIKLIKGMIGKPRAVQSYLSFNWPKNSVSVSFKKLKWFINEDLSKPFVVNSLQKLGYKTNWLLKNRFNPPLWRLDVTNQEDVFEDILKIIDLNKLQPIAIEDKLIPIEPNTEHNLKSSLKNILLNNYFSEVKTYNLTNQSNLNKFNLFKLTNPIKIQCNNSNREYFRTNLIDGMLKVYKYNDARKITLLPIFEIQNIFTNSIKTTNLTCLCLNEYVVDNITHSRIALNLNFFKGILDEISRLFNVNLSFNSIDIHEFYNNETLTISFKNKVIGYVGKIKKSQLKSYDLSNKDIYCLTINIDSLLKHYEPSQFKVKSFGSFQTVSKDVNIVLPKNGINNIKEKLNAIKKIPDISNAEIINIFEKDNNVIYTVRYWLVDTKQFKSNDIDLIAREIDNIR